MKRIIELIEQKNTYLEKFFTLNEKQLALLEQKNYENLNHFYDKREDILKIIKYLDQEIGKDKRIEKFQLNEVEKKRIEKEFSVKEQYVKRIISQDIEILSFIEKEKNNIIKELQGVNKTKSVFSNYKSPTGQYGHKRLNEEV